jgi:hypothetical protein
MPGNVRGPSKTAAKPRLPKKPKAPKQPKAKKPKVANPGTWQESAGAGAGKSSSTSLGATGHIAGSGLAPIDLADLGGGAVSAAGLGDALLDLVGEGQLRLSHALQAWQREQDRVANRAWRRPGGMARMGGV